MISALISLRIAGNFGLEATLINRLALQRLDTFSLQHRNSSEILSINYPLQAGDLKDRDAAVFEIDQAMVAPLVQHFAHCLA